MASSARLVVPVRRVGSSRVIGLVLAVAIVATLTGLVAMFQTDAGDGADIQSFISTIVAVSFAGAAGLYLLAFIIHRRTMTTISIDRHVDGTTKLQLGEQVITDTVELVYDYCPGQVVRAPNVRMTKLWCDFHIGEVLTVRLMHQLGAIYSPPDHWDPLRPPLGRVPQLGSLNCSTVVKLVDQLKSFSSPD